MVRKGWSVMELPSDGWVKDVAASPSSIGPVASSTEETLKGGVEPCQRWWWAMEEEPRVRVSNGHEQGAQFSSSSQSSGPRRASYSRGARGIVATCQSGGAEAQRISQTPDSVVAVAREKVAKLEKVMEVLQGSIWSRSAIRLALDRARVAAQEKPLTEQIADCKGFVERAQKRLVKLEAERDAENALLEEGRARLARLEAQAAARVVAPPPPASTAVSNLEVEVARLRAELAATHVTPADPIARGFRAHHSRGGRVVVEEQTTGGRRNHFRQHIGCCEIGFLHCRGRKSVASLDATPRLRRAIKFEKAVLFGAEEFCLRSLRSESRRGIQPPSIGSTGGFVRR